MSKKFNEMVYNGRTNRDPARFASNVQQTSYFYNINSVIWKEVECGILELLDFMGNSLENRIEQFTLAAWDVLMTILPQFLNFVRSLSKPPLSLNGT